MINSDEKNVMNNVPIADNVINSNVTDIDDNIIDYYIYAETSRSMMMKVLRMN